MKLLPLLGRQLKDDDIIDILEGFDMDVVYDFDRLHEGQPDRYWASSKEAGLQLGFDADQALETVFVYVSHSDGFTDFSQKDCDISFFTTASAVQLFGEAQRLQAAKGSADFMGVTRDWVRLEFAAHSVHYEYHGGSLALVTITRKPS